jgi:hypothetical protein
VTWDIAILLALLIAWLAWPQVLRYLWRRGQITPTVTTALLFARAPTITGLGALLFGAPPLFVLLAVGAMALGSMLLFRYFKEFFSDPSLR